MTKHNETLEAIAERVLGIPTLRTRNSDRGDFHAIAVWRLRDALDAAYAAGVASTQPQPRSPLLVFVQITHKGSMEAGIETAKELTGASGFELVDASPDDGWVCGNLVIDGDPTPYARSGSVGDGVGVCVEWEIP